MKKCNEYLEILAEGSFFKLTAKQQKKIEQELEKEPACAEEFRKMKKTIEISLNAEIPEPGKSYWDNYWDRLDQRMEKKKPIKQQDIWPVVYKAVAFIITGIFIGYLLFYQPAGNKLVQTSQTMDARQIVLSNETAQLLEDSKILLLGIVNLDATDESSGTIDFSFQKEISADLLKKTADLKQMLQDSPNRRVISLLSDLEIILMQISNLDDEFDLPAIEIIRNGANNQSIMFKINMEKMLLDARMESSKGKTPANKQEKKS